jgi:hypothetical protein
MPVDLKNVLKELYSQRERLERVITSLEALHQDTVGAQPAGQKSNRGRKSMGPEERRVVSERMRNYWAARRKNKVLTAS